MMRTAGQEKALCRRLANLWLDGDRGEVTAEALAVLLFDQREAARANPDAVEKHVMYFHEIEAE